MLRLKETEFYAREKGNIGEAMVRYLLHMIGFTLIADHPWDEGGRESDSLRHGPDLLVRSNETGELYYLEAKWYIDSEKAYEEARDQVRDYWRMQHETLNGSIKGAYVAILNWDTRDNLANLRVEKVLG